MTPDKIDHTNDNDCADNRVELVEVFAEFAPVLTEFHTQIGQGQAPGPRSEKCVDVKAAAWHAGNSRGERDKSANDRQEAGDEYGEISPTLKEAVGPIQLATAH